MRLADRLSVARHRRFVGRTTERAQFQAALTAPELPFQILYVHGPGGVGKTTLLGEFAFLCSQVGISAIRVDCRSVDPSPDAFLGALRGAMNLSASESPLQVMEKTAGRCAVLVDTYETAASLDPWLRDTFLPQAPENALFVFAGREPPALAWRTDPGWQVLLRAVPLRNLTRDEGRTYLAQRDVPAEEYETLLGFTHGHPLALSLVADVFEQRGELHFQPESAPDVIRTLLQQFVQKAPGPAHRSALEACALVRVTTETLLGAMLDMNDVHEMFEWLRDLSFVETGPTGLFPHDLARDALVADLRWRNPDWYARLHHRARTYYGTRLQQANPVEQQRLLVDYIFLHRHNPVVRPFFEELHGGAHSTPPTGSLLLDSMRPEDVEAVEEMVSRHEGQASARFFAHWAEVQPDSVLVMRDAERRPQGVLSALNLDDRVVANDIGDPGVAAVWDYLVQRAPLRAGERATLFRHWMARDSYQAVSPVQSMIFVNMVRHYLTTPALAHSFVPSAEPDFWAPMFAYADLARLSEADFTVGGRRFGVYGHDWRVVPPSAWLDLLGERELATAVDNRPTQAPADPLIVLSYPDFAAAVHDVLRQFHRPETLRNNPLLRSRLVAEQAGPTAAASERVEALRELITRAAESLLRSPRDTRLHQVVDRTYFRAAQTQEQAAELLDLPFSTYRRHLKAAVTRISDLLWQHEVEGA